jgi:hypothetical protein
MGKLFRNIIGLAFVAASVAIVGADRQSQQLHCQKVAPQVANCRSEIKTLAGWGGSVEDFADVRSAKVGLVNAPLSDSETSAVTIVKLYPVFLIDRAGNKSQLEYISQNYEPISTKIADRVNQFLRSAEPKTTIDLSGTGWSWNYTESGNISGGQGTMPHGQLIFGLLFGGAGMLLLSWPWLWPWWRMRRMNPQLRSMLESDRGL